MTEYSRSIEEIAKSKSLDEIKKIAQRYSAQATGEGGILYSGMVGPKLRSEAVAVELARKSGAGIINDTSRAQFLSDNSVDAAIKQSARRIFVGQGMGQDAAIKAVEGFLYGDSNAATESPCSIQNCLWGQASREFASSLKGDVKVVAAEASSERVFAKVEVPAVLQGSEVRSLGGRPVEELKKIEVQSGVNGVLNAVQTSFREAMNQGIHLAPDGKSAVVSKEAAATLGFDGSRFSDLNATPTLSKAALDNGANKSPSANSRDGLGEKSYQQVPNQGKVNGTPGDLYRKAAPENKASRESNKAAAGTEKKNENRPAKDAQDVLRDKLRQQLAQKVSHGRRMGR